MTDLPVPVFVVAVFAGLVYAFFIAAAIAAAVSLWRESRS